MMQTMIPDGVYVTMVTPFSEDNKIDYGAVERLIQWYTEHGVDGIFAICQSSEIFFLSFEERMQLLRFILKNRPKEMTVIASGHTADDLNTQTKEAVAFVEAGPDAYVFISNRFAKQGEDDTIFLRNMQTVVGALGGVDLGIYECPYPYKRLMHPELLRRMIEMGQFKFLKDTSCDLGMMEAKLHVMAGTGFKLFNANSATFLESLKLGCSGFSGVMANFHPELYSWLCENYLLEPERAQAIQDFIGFFSVVEYQNYPINAKYYLGTLEKLGFGYYSRAKNPADFTLNRRMEIDQMWSLTQQWKSR
jgi:4-hydroxy-tetrahydrodipicolinate synthase